MVIPDSRNAFCILNNIFLCIRGMNCLPFVSTRIHPHVLVGSVVHLFSVVFACVLSSSCVLCVQCCQWILIVHSWLPLRFSLTFGLSDYMYLRVWVLYVIMSKFIKAILHFYIQLVPFLDYFYTSSSCQI